MAIPLNMRFYKYRIEAFDILLGSETIKVEPSHINSILIEKDFDNDYFPVFRVATMLDTTVYKRIVANKLTVRFRFRMQKYIYDSNNDLTVKKDVFNSLFCIFLDDNTPFLDESTREQTKEAIDVDKTPQSIGSEEQVFYLFKEKDIMSTQTITNAVLSGVTMTDAVVYSLASRGISNVLMSPLDNKAQYDEVLLPPYTLFGAMQYLEAAYGFYQRGVMLFFDIDRIYFIKQYSLCTAWAPQEYKKTIFNIKKTINPDNLSPGSYENTEEKNYFINVIPTDITMSNPSVINDLTDGNKLIIVTPSTGKIVKVNPDTVQVGNGSYKVLVDKFNSQFAIETERYKRDETGSILQLNIGDFDIDAFSPNKEFMFTFEDANINKNYGGPYRISQASFIFTKQGDDFTISGQHIFKRIKEYKGG